VTPALNGRASLAGVRPCHGTAGASVADTRARGRLGNDQSGGHLEPWRRPRLSPASTSRASIRAQSWHRSPPIQARRLRRGFELAECCCGWPRLRSTRPRTMTSLDTLTRKAIAMGRHDVRTSCRWRSSTRRPQSFRNPSGAVGSNLTESDLS
jgi:hypothetical protein